MPAETGPFVPLVVIPCLNEARHIEAIIRQMAAAVEGMSGLVIVVDGGSTDGTAEMAARLAARLVNVEVMDNPARLQGPGINAAVRRFGAGRSHLVRVDAHCGYPEDFVDALWQDAAESGATSVVVGMVAAGDRFMQRINALTQNARIGNGGAEHRRRGGGRFVEHGHHALMRLDAFNEVGGYDESFSHNEDAELDMRLVRAGHRIWLTAATEVTYFPRETLSALAWQYFNHGRGRARTFLKHRPVPKPRQIAVIGVLPALALALAAPFNALFALPALVWATATLAGGTFLAVSRREPLLLLAGPVALCMHASWSAGFWRHVFAQRPQALRGSEA